MTKKIMVLGKPLTNKQQKEVKGGIAPSSCRTARDCEYVFGIHMNATNDYSCIRSREYGLICVSNT